MLRGYGASADAGGSEVEDIVCPDGWNIVVDSKGNPVCDNGTGGQVPPVFKPSTHTANALGIVGWSIAAATALLVGSALMHKGHR